MKVHRLVVEFSDATLQAWAETGDLAAQDSPSTWSLLDLAAFLTWARDQAAYAVDVRGGGVRVADRSVADRAEQSSHAARG